ncbi:NinX [Salmonella phage LPSTLL]|uniref:NinX n=1 Tax=Salmonella phage LPSTLL TaxID=3071280 RepID=A0A8E4ATM4_9CAUD|nr:NinX [Salmonella phage LPSTLL]QGZ15035.1 NinX [Salmonella phage LPSTLL]
MKNYEEMSDFEINCRVHADVMQISGLNSFKAKDYCNNPDDAWPIIVKDEIDVIQNNGRDCPLATNSAVMMFRGDDVFICQHENPLRAAMIVFLKMNEDKL